jgi:hypothetical protein
MNRRGETRRFLFHCEQPSRQSKWHAYPRRDHTATGAHRGCTPAVMIAWPAPARSVRTQNQNRGIIGLLSAGKFVKRAEDRIYEFVRVLCRAFKRRFRDAFHSPFLA